jgi:hypothetical protein
VDLDKNRKRHCRGLEEALSYIKVKKLKEGWLYCIDARNAEYGIWFKSEQGFVIRRKKFNAIYTFTEIHWDLSKDFGTVKPLLELEKSPFTMKDLEYKEEKGNKIHRVKEEEILTWLEKKEKYWNGQA